MLIPIFGLLRGFLVTATKTPPCRQCSNKLQLTWNNFRKHTKLSEKPRNIQNIALVRFRERILSTYHINSQIMETSGLTIIEQYQQDPVDMFRDVLSYVPAGLITMNLATIDSELGILNRTVVYRGLTEGAITFVTQRNTRKYFNLRENPKLALTFYFPDLTICTKEVAETWQVRLFDATAVELSPEQTKCLWQQEALFAKIRAHICECGAPVDPAELKKQHDQLLSDSQNGADLPQPNNYCAFAVKTNCWDFYKGEPFKIADRIQYRRDNSSGAWQVLHVAA